MKLITEPFCIFNDRQALIYLLIQAKTLMQVKEQEGKGLGSRQSYVL